MQNKLTRRDMLVSGLGFSAVAVAGTALAGTGSLLASPSSFEDKKLSQEEKKKLKEQLQRELERKVYAVSDELFREVNHVKSPGKYEGHEKGHVPVIIAPKRVKYLEPFSLRIEIGPVSLHDMIPFHYIDWISLYVGNVQINNVVMTPLFNRPIVTLEITLEQTSVLRAQEHCNLHGIWESEPFTIEVLPTSNDKDEKL
ncbi:MAG: desulfoferrodoxin family protein [Candidatus Anammoxibacter sp.]